MPQLIIVPITELRELTKSTKEMERFFAKVPLEAIIDLMLCVENSTDLSTSYWEEIEDKLSDDEIEHLNLVNIDFMLEIMTEIFYQILRSMFAPIDISFKSYHWLPDAVCLIPVNRPTFNADDYPPAPF